MAIDRTRQQATESFVGSIREPIKALGEPFDPNFHQAMMQEESEDQPANTVINEMQKGYKLHDRLLRPAMVVVSKAKKEES